MAGPKDRKHSNGHDKGTRESRVSLASFYRGKYPPALQAEFYDCVLRGQIPNLVDVDEDEECHENCDCGRRFIGEKPTLAMHGPTIDHKFLAVARIMERSYGQPAQHTHIEAEIRAEVTAIAGGVDVRYLNKLSPQALLAIKNAVKGLTPQALPSGEPDVKIQVAPIDAEFEEVDE